jgi:hypothetical protein
MAAPKVVWFVALPDVWIVPEFHGWNMVAEYPYVKDKLRAEKLDGGEARCVTDLVQGFLPQDFRGTLLFEPHFEFGLIRLSSIFAVLVSQLNPARLVSTLLGLV